MANQAASSFLRTYSRTCWPDLSGWPWAGSVSTTVQLRWTMTLRPRGDRSS
ncbi:hypothetical protein ACQP2X_34560 [Actinoplanes sp. CA-131856]